MYSLEKTSKHRTKVYGKQKVTSADRKPKNENWLLTENVFVHQSSYSLFQTYVAEYNLSTWVSPKGHNLPMWAMMNVPPLCLVSPHPNASKCASQRGVTTTHALPALKIRNRTEIRARRSRKLGAKDCIVRCGVRTHALSREPELKSGALDHSANLTLCIWWAWIAGPQDRASTILPRGERTNSARQRNLGPARLSQLIFRLLPRGILCHRNSLFTTLSRAMEQREAKMQWWCKCWTK